MKRRRHAPKCYSHAAMPLLTITGELAGVDDDQRGGWDVHDPGVLVFSRRIEVWFAHVSEEQQVTIFRKRKVERACRQGATVDGRGRSAMH
jgi:hypothetical protein